jgi:hypothetical protein
VGWSQVHGTATNPLSSGKAKVFQRAACYEQ